MTLGAAILIVLQIVDLDIVVVGGIMAWGGGILFWREGKSNDTSNIPSSYIVY